VSKLPLLSQNAYLSVFISQKYIYAHLAYTYYDTNSSYILKDISRLPISTRNINLNEFWLDYFTNLENKWGWEILSAKKVSSDKFANHLKSFEDEGVGLRGCSFKISRDNTNSKEWIDSLREFSLDLKVSTVNKLSEKKIFGEIAYRLGYQDCIFLNLSVQSLKMYRFEENESVSRGIGKVGSDVYDVSEAIYKWKDEEKIMEVVKGEKYLAFLKQYLNENFRYNIWANFLSKPTLYTQSATFKDFVRAYLTLQLLSISQIQNQICSDFGLKKPKNLICLTGEIIGIPEFRDLLVSIIDGFEIQGNFDFYVDYESLIYTFGSSFSKGKNAEDVIFTKDNFLPNFTKVFIPELEIKKGRRKLVFEGLLKELDKESGLNINVMSSEFTDIKIDKAYNSIFEGRLSKSAFIEHYSKDIAFECFAEGITWERVVFDCRFKPVMYGPGPRENENKFKSWFTDEFN